MAEFLTPGVLMGGMSLLGGAAGLLGGSGGSGGTTRQSYNSTQTNSPWSGIQGYLLGTPDGQTGPLGVYPEASRLYGSTGWTPQMQGTTNDWFNDIFNNRASGQHASPIGNQMLTGGFDPHLTAAGPIGPNAITPGNATPVAGRELQGSLNPTDALTGFLRGDATNPWVEKQGQAITDTLTRNLKENVLPGIRHNAIAEGQYGGSRGDMAEGLALSRLSTDIAPALTQLAGNTYENEQGRKFGLATDLNHQGADMLTGNVNRTFQGDTLNAGNLLDALKFNTGTTLSNNAQEMQRAAQAVGTRGAGLNFLGGAQNLTDQYYGDMLKALGLPGDYDWSNLGRYSSLVSPGAQFQTTTGSGTSTGTAPGTGGSGVAGAFGGAATGLGSGNALFGRNGMFGGGRSDPLLSGLSGWGY